MTPQDLLKHLDAAALWPVPSGGVAQGELAQAYQLALQVRALRQARGERPKGIKIGFTNRTIWPLYDVHQPIWGTVWDTTCHTLDAWGQGHARLDALCQPRLEPEVVFGLRATPRAGDTLEQLFQALDWLAPGFELVQSHLPDWRFAIADTAADSGLHGQLWMGPRTPVTNFAASGEQLAQRLAQANVKLHHGPALVHTGHGAAVLDSPLHALHHVVQVLAACPGAPPLQPGDVVTTGTWTDAPPIEAGQTWRAQFSWTPHPISLTLHQATTPTVEPLPT
jgi:2-keto-4-pentenoate hydratase